MALTGDILAQALATTSATSILAPSGSQEAWIRQIRIVNVSGAPRWVKIWADRDGAVFDDVSLIFPQRTIDGGAIVFDVGLLILRGDAGAQLGIQGQAASTIGVHVVGLMRT